MALPASKRSHGGISLAVPAASGWFELPGDYDPFNFYPLRDTTQGEPLSTLRHRSSEKQAIVPCCHASIRDLVWKQWGNGLPEPITDHQALVIHGKPSF